MHRTIAFFALLAGVLLVGCQDKETPKADNKNSSTPTGEAKKPGHTHHGWWCTPHGIPEEDCLACIYEGREEELKKKGDWCDKHDYCKSQCFGCDPKLKERYAAQYKAKYGKEAPEPTDNPPGKNPDK
jgi:hypothetical protein